MLTHQLMHSWMTAYFERAQIAFSIFLHVLGVSEDISNTVLSVSL